MLACLALSSAVARAATTAGVPRAACRAAPQVTLTQVSSDPYKADMAEHATESEPDTYSNGSTIVSAFMVGEWMDIGWATSTDGGTTWQHGFLPITSFGGGSLGGEVFDPSVAYDPKAKLWLISALETGSVSVDTSPDGHPLVHAGGGGVGQRDRQGLGHL